MFSGEGLQEEGKDAPTELGKDAQDLFERPVLTTFTHCNLAECGSCCLQHVTDLSGKETITRVTGKFDPLFGTKLANALLCLVLLQEGPKCLVSLFVMLKRNRSVVLVPFPLFLSLMFIRLSDRSQVLSGHFNRKVLGPGLELRLPDGSGASPHLYF